MPRIYLDNAATSWPKPDAIYEAVDRFGREVGASHGRGAYPSAAACASMVAATREGVARLFGEADPRRIVFAASGTDALAIAIHGLLRPGDHAVATVVEHNAVLRPLAAMDVETTIVGCDAAGRVDPAGVAAALRPDTRLVAVSHASNVTGAVQPVEEIAAALRGHPALLMVDAAQTAGRWPIDVARLGADLLAAPGHKGLLGPLGTGVLWIRDGVESQLRPLRYGGTGADSLSAEMPNAMPDRFEAGSLNAPGVAGLGAGVEVLLEQTVEVAQARISAGVARIVAGLSGVDGVRLLGAPQPDRNAGVVTLTIRGYAPGEAAALLASVAGVECRAGLHCAPAMHRALGSAPDGAVRLSPGLTTADAEVDAAVDAIRMLAASPPV